MPEATGFPLKEAELRDLCQKICNETLADATEYDHKAAPRWNQAIINKIIEALATSTAPEDGKPAPYKFAVNSTIIQNSVGGGSAERRGMFSSVGAYWNQEKDGMWSYKHDAGEKLGLEVVMSIIWISV